MIINEKEKIVYEVKFMASDNLETRMLIDGDSLEEIMDWFTEFISKEYNRDKPNDIEFAKSKLISLNLIE